MLLLLTMLSLAGLGVSIYIWYKQVTTGPVACIGRGCATVIRSRYGRLLGVPNGAWGVIFFGGLLGAVIAGALIPGFEPVLTRLAALATAIALILFVYLTYLQVVVLRTFCSWCLTSAGLTLAIFLVLLTALGS
ncbi:MAG: vitamin K epoxide reductase family protein [bacterium]